MATAKITLFKGKKYRDNKHPVMLRVTHSRRSKYFSLNVSCREDQWDEEQSRLNGKFKGYREKNRLLSIFEEKANKAIDELIIEGRPFTFGTFERKFTVTNRSFRFFEFLDEFIVDLKKKDKVGNAATYKQLRNALWNFTENSNLMFPDINYRFLKKFEAYLFGRGCSGGGVNYYMRTLRAIINEATRQDYMYRDLYPFSTQFNKRGYSLNSLKSNAKPRALSIEDGAIF